MTRPPNSLVSQTFDSIASKFSNRTALTCGDQTLSYQQLANQSDTLAAYLVEQGVEPGDLVGVSCDRRPELIVSLLAILKAGAAYVPFDSAYPASQLRTMAEDSGITVLIGENAHLADLSLQQIPFEAIPDETAEAPDIELTADALAYVMFTSGSTGRPKGVAVPHRGILRLVTDPNYCELDEDEKILQHSPVAFDASTFEIWGALLNGAELVLMPKAEVSLRFVGEIIQQYEITTMWLTAGLFHAMVDERPDDLAGLNQLLTGGDVVSPAHAKKIFEHCPNLTLINGYGPTENTTFTCCHTISIDDTNQSSLPIGKAISGTDVFVTYADLNLVEDGEQGELCCAGDGLALGYWKNEELTKQVFVEAPWDASIRLYRTGDLVCKNEQGTFDFLGRIDQQVKIRGFRIELGEIENQLLEFEKVEKACVIAEAIGDGTDKRLIAYYVGSEEIEREKFKEQLKENLPSHSVPNFYHRLDELPLNPNGKVDRKKLSTIKPEIEQQPVEIQPNSSATSTTIIEAICDVLGIDSISKQTNYFDLGASSIQIARIHERVQTGIGKTFPVTDFFQFPNAQALAEHLDQANSAQPAQSRTKQYPQLDEPIAVIGYAGRFPGAKSVEELWTLICEGREGIRDLSDDELAEKGVPNWMINHPRYVKRGADIHAADELDANLFGISHKEATITDPQGRVFLETCHDALLHAGCPPQKYDGRIGLFGGAGIRSYSWRKVNYSDLGIDQLTEMVGNEKDFLTTRISYRLGLTGVSVPVQTACSSSLVAIHLARQSLLCGDSDIAIAGGVSLNFPHGVGYMAAEGTMFSESGRCRVFDKDADGTMFAQGAGAVILKRLSEAQADGDIIHGVLMGTGVNNDGARKVGFTAPSIQGQSGAITDALGNFDPRDLRYIEAHGTATQMGDPIELRGLEQVFDQHPESPDCLIGSIKSNLGHLDAAAGITGFLKALLIAKHGIVPPTINHEFPTEAFDFENSRFHVNTEIEKLPSCEDKPTLLGVSSFGVGGTNAHAILSPPPVVEEIQQENTSDETPRVVPVSAGSITSLGRELDQLAEWVESAKPSQNDLAYNLCHNRPDLKFRTTATLLPDEKGGYQFVYSDDKNDWSKAIDHQGTVFLFTGQGAQYFSMAKGLYQNEPVFKETFDQISVIADPILDLSLYNSIFEDESNADKLKETWLTQIALFAIEVANARLWQSYGIQPQAMTGHSVGEFAAATIAGVFTLEDATKAVIERGRLMFELPRGKMVAIPKSAAEVEQLIADEPKLNLASENSAELCVIAGPTKAIKAFIKKQAAKDLILRKLHTSHAFHSSMMKPAIKPFKKFIKSLGQRSAPQIPILSNVTGDWLTEDQATSADYWANHILEPVRFAKGIRKVLDESYQHYIELGPGRTLSTFVRKSLSNTDNAVAIESISHPADRGDDHLVFLNATGHYWANGGDVDWNQKLGKNARKLELPRYSYDRKQFWRPLDNAENSTDKDVKNPDLSQWFYAPKWQKVPNRTLPNPQVEGDILILSGGKLSKTEIDHFESQGNQVTNLYLDKKYRPLKNRKATARAGHLDDFISICKSLETAPNKVILAPSFNDFNLRTALNRVHVRRTAITESVLHFLQAAMRVWADADFDLTLASDQAVDVVGNDLVNPEDATLRGIARVIAVELPQFKTRWVDLDRTLTSLPQYFPEDQTPEWAIRNNRLWQAGWQKQVLEAKESSPFENGKTYVITGGTGGIGLEMARRIGTENKANLVLVARSPIPERDSKKGKSARFKTLFSALDEIEDNGSQTLIVNADVSRPEMVATIKTHAVKAFGGVDGVLHAAGVLFDSPIALKEKVSLDQVLRPKIEASYSLADTFSDSEFLLLFSSISSSIPPAGQYAYSAGNQYMDALANQQTESRGIRIHSVNWASWREVGMAARHRNLPGAEFLQEEFENGIELDEGFECINRVITSGISQLTVYPRDFVAAYQRHGTVDAKPIEPMESSEMDESSEPPQNELETQLLEFFFKSIRRRDIGVLDEFFELGGDSLSAVSLLTRIRQEIGVVLPNSILYQAPHVRSLANWIENQRNSTAETPKPKDKTNSATTKVDQSELANYVIPIETEGTGFPIFGIHGAGGSIMFYNRIAQAFSGLHPFYAIEEPLIHNEADQFLFKNVHDKAKAYLEEILKVSPEGPIALIGYSFGTDIAVEIARIIEADYPDRKCMIINIDQSGSKDAFRPLSFSERIRYAWNRQPYSSKLEKICFLAKRFVAAVSVNISEARGRRAYKELLETGLMHTDETKRFRQILQHNNLLDSEYAPQPIRTPMVLLKGDDQGDKYEHPNDLGWSKIVPSLQHHQIPGDHYKVVSAENQAFVTNQITTSIERVLSEKS